MMAALSLRMGRPELPLLVRPPKMREGSMRMNSTGSMSRTAMAARNFLPCCAAYLAAPAAAPYGPPTAAPFAAAEMALPVLMAPWIVWAVLAAWDRLLFSWLFSFGYLPSCLSVVFLL